MQSFKYPDCKLKKDRLQSFTNPAKRSEKASQKGPQSQKNLPKQRLENRMFFGIVFGTVFYDFGGPKRRWNLKKSLEKRVREQKRRFFENRVPVYTGARFLRSGDLGNWTEIPKKHSRKDAGKQSAFREWFFMILEPFWTWKRVQKSQKTSPRNRPKISCRTKMHKFKKPRP